MFAQSRWSYILARKRRQLPLDVEHCSPLALRQIVLDVPDRCTGSVAVTTVGSTCSVGQGDDPFVSSTPGHDDKKCKGTGCESTDSRVSCSIDVNDVLQNIPTCGSHKCSNNSSEYCDTNADCVPLTDVCSYPSEQPNSDPSDCIITNPKCANVDCSDLDDECNTGECDPATAECIKKPKGEGIACTDDGNPCTDDVSNRAGVCSHPNDDTNTCGSPSNTDCDNPDTCVSGECKSNHESETTPSTTKLRKYVKCIKYILQKEAVMDYEQRIKQNRVSAQYPPGYS